MPCLVNSQKRPASVSFCLRTSNAWGLEYLGIKQGAARPGVYSKALFRVSESFLDTQLIRVYFQKNNTFPVEMAKTTTHYTPLLYRFRKHVSPFQEHYFLRNRK